MDLPNNEEIVEESGLPDISSQEELMNKFDEFVKNNNVSISPEKVFDYIARISFFFNNADSSKLTPYFNKSLGHEMYNGTSVSRRNLYTVPKTINNYYEFGKGNLIPFCEFSGIDEDHSSRNDYKIFVDLENDIVYATVGVTRLIKGKSGKVIDEADFSLANYCIPSLSSLIRGRSEDIIRNNTKPLTFDEKYDNYADYEEAIKKAVIMVSRVDTDGRHPNDFSDIPNLNRDKQKLARQIFKESAEEPHLHFCYKDYIVRHKKADSAALAISLNQLPNYLMDLKFAGKDDDILRESFGLPFVDVRKRQMSYNHEDIKELTSGIRDTYSYFSKNDKKAFLPLYNDEIELLAKKIGKEKNESTANEFKKQAEIMLKVLTGESENDNSKDYVRFDSLTLITLEAQFLKVLNKLKVNSSRLKSKFNSSFNDLYSTINASLGSKKYLDKRKITTQVVKKEDEPTNENGMIM